MAIFTLVVFISDRELHLPRTVLILATIFTVFGLVGFRMAWRLIHEPDLRASVALMKRRADRGGGQPLVIVGSLASANTQMRNLKQSLGDKYAPLAILTPERSEVGLRFHDVPVVQQISDRTFDTILRWPGVSKPVAVLFLGDPANDFNLKADQIGELRKRGHSLLRQERIAEMSEGEANSRMLREIPLEEFLPRQPIRLDRNGVEALIRGKRVIVTGAGGSIGSEIARQMVGLGCHHLTMIDHSEFLLFEIDRELGARPTAMTRRAVVANIRDTDRLLEIFEEEKPDLVFHAAALKHVTLMENNPAEAVLTNVKGTWNVLNASVRVAAQQFVLISTDKAVAPSNVMGATKRIAESLLSLVESSSTQLSVVRFGNVLGSAGSVIPIFQDQISRGGPVTVTHPDVCRYFMTIPEAVQLVLHSTAVKAKSGDQTPSKFLLEMGQPVKIVDLARQMIELNGQEADVDVKITFTGLKPGEKIMEELADADEDTRPCIEGVLEVVAADRKVNLSRSQLERLIGTAEGGSQGLREMIKATVDNIRNIK